MVNASNMLIKVHSFKHFSGIQRCLFLYVVNTFRYFLYKNFPFFSFFLVRPEKKKKVIPLTIGAWNVHTLMDSDSSDRPQRKTVLVDRELDRYKVEIAALSETRLAEEGLLKEVGAGYTFFWSGRKKEERREAGVRFAIVTPRQQALRNSKRHK